MIDVYEHAMKNNVAKYSAIGNPEFREFFKNTKVDIVVEIGTFRGIAAAYMAQFVNKVHTFDVIDYLEKYKIWEDLGVKDKITFYLIKGRDGNVIKNHEGEFPANPKAVDIKPILDNIKFNGAFIDGRHSRRDVEADFEFVKKCGRVLFHDVAPEGSPVHEFVQEIKVKITGNIGYWEKEC